MPSFTSHCLFGWNASELWCFMPFFFVLVLNFLSKKNILTKTCDTDQSVCLSIKLDLLQSQLLAEISIIKRRMNSLLILPPRKMENKLKYFQQKNFTRISPCLPSMLNLKAWLKFKQISKSTTRDKPKNFSTIDISGMRAGENSWVCIWGIRGLGAGQYVRRVPL